MNDDNFDFESEKTKKEIEQIMSATMGQMSSVVKIMYEGICELSENDEFLDRFSLGLARMAKAMYDAFVRVGFDRDAALALVQSHNLLRKTN